MKKLLISLLFVPVMAHAEFHSGNSLLDKLKSPEVMDRIQALGYIQGVSDTLQNGSHCIPGNVTAGQLVDMVKNYLENVPMVRNKTADEIVVHVLKTAWPCANRPAGRGA